MRWIIATVLSAFVGAVCANDVGQVKVTKGIVHVEREGARIPATVGMPIRRADRLDRKSTRLNSSHIQKSRMPSSA